MGYVADRVQRVWLVRLAALFQAGGALLTGLATGVPMLVGGRLLGGIGPGVGEPALFPLATDYFPMRSRARVVSFVLVTAGIGGVIGPTVAGRLSDAFGWRFAIAILSVLSFIVFGLSFLLREPKRGYLDRLEAGASAEDAGREQAALSWGEGWRAARSIVTLRRFWYATPFQFAAFLATVNLLPVYFAQEFGLSASSRGYVVSAMSAAGLISLVAFGPLADRFMFIRPQLVPTLLGISIAVSALAVAAIAIVNNLWLAIAIVIPLGIVRILLAPAYVTFVSLVVPARVRGLGIQTLAPWQLLGFVIASFVIFPAANSWGIRAALALLIPMLLIQAVITISAGSGVDRDIRAAIAASMADEEAERARKARRRQDAHLPRRRRRLRRRAGALQRRLRRRGGRDRRAARHERCRQVDAAARDRRRPGGVERRDLPRRRRTSPTSRRTRTHVDGIVLMPGGHGDVPDAHGGREPANRRLDVPRGRGLRPDAHRGGARHASRSCASGCEQQAGNLSGGEQQMLALGQAFLMRPRLLMIDELSLGLAPAIVEQLLDIAPPDPRSQGTTIVLVEQSVNVALTVAERAVFMEKGEIRFDGPTERAAAAGPTCVRSVFLGGAGGGASRRDQRAAAPPSARRADERRAGARRARTSPSASAVCTALDGASVEVARRRGRRHHRPERRRQDHAVRRHLRLRHAGRRRASSSTAPTSTRSRPGRARAPRASAARSRTPACSRR